MSCSGCNYFSYVSEMVTANKSSKVHLLLSIDLKASSDIFALIFDIFVHTGGTKSILETLESWPMALCVLLPVLDLQVNWLVFFMIGSSSTDACQDIETDLAVRLGVFNGLVLVSWLCCPIVCSLVLERPWCFPTEYVGF